MTETRIVRVPSSSTPITVGIESIIEELEYHELDASSLKGIPIRLSSQITIAARALQRGEMTQVKYALNEAYSILHDTMVALKMVRIMTRRQVPPYVADHLLVMKALVEGALHDIHNAAEATGHHQSTGI